ncbi:beta-Ala-His dipeptidase-like isoform X2 [Erythrolamprus reginae]|uniref:beta-Ala-His dipeptidase-like isoform X2 n=1 Tax=Erythrolamprus reginae TaxID=121349 RepID=UPI00396C3159
MLPFGVGNSLFSNSSPLEEQLFNYIDEHQDEFVQKLKEWVAIESDSQQPRLREKVIEMVKITAECLEDLGANVTLSEMGIQQLSDTHNIPLPPVILANLGDDAQKPTVCFYGHVDVMPAKSQDGWKTHPYNLTEIDGNLYGRGATDNKGPVLAWINAVRTFKALNIVEGGEKDLHSGSAGGIIHEPMSDLVALLDSLVNSSGLILIPGIYDDVAPFTEEEKKQYKLIEFDVQEHKSNLGVKEFLYDTKEKILSHMWRLPSLSIHGIEGAFYEPGIKTVIPSKVIGKFSIRQVPHMDLSKVEHQVKKHLENVFSNRRSPNKLTVSMVMSAVPWIANINDPQYTAARKAIRKVFNQDPDMIRDGSTIPIARVFQNITRKSVMMLPIGAMDDGEHSQKEKISRFNYINGTKMFASFLVEISKLEASNWKQ